MKYYWIKKKYLAVLYGNPFRFYTCFLVLQKK